jgi:hypothetical protein
MLRIITHTIAFIGLLGIILGITGEPTILLCGCVLVGSALIAASIQSLKDK